MSAISKNTLLQKKVEQSGAIVEAKYSLSKDEQRLILLASQKEPDQDGWFYIRVNDYAAAFNLTINEASRDVRQVHSSLYERSLSIHDNNEFVDLRWVSARKRNTKTGVYGFRFSEELLPYLKDLSKKVSYPLGDVSKFTNTLHIRLFAWLSNHREEGELILALDYIKERLELDSLSAYKRFDNFRRRVLEPAVEKINQYSSLKVNYELIKSGRKVDSIHFKIESATNRPNDL
ncbi:MULTISPECIES: replication initiation protein [Pseudoalteromonas]|uniref:replication initiation protein n=1 Tax=Pseudoalteromonas TaxID=53246 RepID=UPI001EF475A9|nr:replication initiation protein [Pseudoalteromonas sp. Of11M-6]MCG7556340.1 replication initiation protein [Pseudoalteromonas sp. Of11M-6]